MHKLIAVLFAVTLAALSGCASRGSVAGDSATAPSGSGITVFGTIDANVSGSRNR